MNANTFTLVFGGWQLAPPAAALEVAPKGVAQRRKRREQALHAAGAANCGIHASRRLEAIGWKDRNFFRHRR